MKSFNNGWTGKIKDTRLYLNYILEENKLLTILCGQASYFESKSMSCKSCCSTCTLSTQCEDISNLVQHIFYIFKKLLSMYKKNFTINRNYFLASKCFLI